MVLSGNQESLQGLKARFCLALNVAAHDSKDTDAVDAAEQV
jgi:hypothetical protein